MKSESSKLLLGLGIGTVVGIAVGYLLNGNSRHQLEHKMCEMGHDIKEGAKSVFSGMKAKAEYAGAKMAGKAEEWSEKAEQKAEAWANEADQMAQKAHDWKQKMEHKLSEEDEMAKSDGKTKK